MVNPWSRNKQSLDLDLGSMGVEEEEAKDTGIDYDEASDDELFAKKKNKNLHKAKSAKNDEFYTQLSDIEAELSHYPIDYFKDKVIYCPTDVAVNTGSIKQSNFVKYFQLNAHRLQFKKLIATCLVEKAAGDSDENWDEVQNCYILERQLVDTDCRYIHSYTTGQGKTNPVVGEKEDLGLKYVEENGSSHNMPYHVVNQAVTEPTGKYKIVARFIDHYDAQTGKIILGTQYKGISWKFDAGQYGKKTLYIKWVRLHPDGTEEVLPDDCYFYNNDDIISNFGLFEEYDYADGNPDPHKQGHKCYETPEEDKGKKGSVCLLPSEYYNYRELDYDIPDGYFKHCPSDGVYDSGDFHSDYCTRLLNEADIVVTNPPFSLFRDFFKWLMDNDKKFIIVGNQNSITQKEIFPYILEGKVWLGTGKSYSSLAGYFLSPYEDYAVAGQHKEGQVRVSGVCWFTNVDHNRLHEPLILVEKYSPEKYPKYDNYDAIDVSVTKKIPMDFYGVMGVPITFMHKYSPDQFEILGCTQRGCHDLVPDTKKYDDYREINCRTGEPTGSTGGKTNENPNLAKNDGKHNYFINSEGHIVQSAYSRIFIKRRTTK